MRPTHLSDKIKKEIEPSSPYTQDSADTNSEKTTGSPPRSNENDNKLHKTTREEEALSPPNTSPHSRNKHTKTSTKRTENWTNDKKIALLLLVKTKREIIETKHRNKDAKQQRNKAWEEIIAEFKSECPRFKNISTNSVKEQYQRLKSQVKKYLTKPDDSKISGDAYSNIVIVKLMRDICQEEFKDFRPDDDDYDDRNKNEPMINNGFRQEEISSKEISNKTSDEENDSLHPEPRNAHTTTNLSGTFKTSTSSLTSVKLEPTKINKIAEDLEKRVPEQRQLNHASHFVAYTLQRPLENSLSPDIRVEFSKPNNNVNRIHSPETYGCDLTHFEFEPPRGVRIHPYAINCHAGTGTRNYAEILNNFSENCHRSPRSQDNGADYDDDLHHKTRPDSTISVDHGIRKNFTCHSNSFVPYDNSQKSQTPLHLHKDQDEACSDDSLTEQSRVNLPVRNQQYSPMYIPYVTPNVALTRPLISEEEFDTKNAKHDKPVCSIYEVSPLEDIEVNKEIPTMRNYDMPTSSGSSLVRNLKKRGKELKSFINTKRRYEMQEFRLKKEKQNEELRMAREKHETEMEMLRLKKQILEQHYQRLLKSAERSSQHSSSLPECNYKLLTNTPGIYTTTHEILNDLYTF